MNTARDLHLLAGLDLSEMDRELVRYIGVLEQWLPPARITFLHNIKLSELPQELKQPERLRTIAAGIERRCKALIAGTHVPRANWSVVITMEEFSELAFMQQVRQQQTGLVLLGNKQRLEGSGGLNQKLIRMLPAAVLLVPETFRGVPAHIIQAVDFSRYTPAVMQWGREAGAHATLRCSPVYVSKMSYHFFPILSDNEMAASLQKDEQEKRRRWKEQYPAYPALQVVPAREKSIATTLLQYAAAAGADMIIMGVKGATSLTNLFMGSVANEMVQRETDLSLLLVKHK